VFSDQWLVVSTGDVTWKRAKERWEEKQECLKYGKEEVIAKDTFETSEGYGKGVQTWVFYTGIVSICGNLPLQKYMMTTSWFSSCYGYSILIESPLGQTTKPKIDDVVMQGSQKWFKKLHISYFDGERLAYLWQTPILMASSMAHGFQDQWSKPWYLYRYR